MDGSNPPQDGTQSRPESTWVTETEEYKSLASGEASAYPRVYVPGDTSTGRLDYARANDLSVNTTGLPARVRNNAQSYQTQAPSQAPTPQGQMTFFESPSPSSAQSARPSGGQHAQASTSHPTGGGMSGGWPPPAPTSVPQYYLQQEYGAPGAAGTYGVQPGYPPFRGAASQAPANSRQYAASPTYSSPGDQYYTATGDNRGVWEYHKAQRDMNKTQGSGAGHRDR